MGLRNIFKDSSNDILTQNKELLEDHDLVNVFGSPNKLFLKFLDSKKLSLTDDEITEELIEEFEGSADSINLRLERIRRQKEIIFAERKVWINIPDGEEFTGADLILHHDGITVENSTKKILYSRMNDIQVSEGGWSRDRITITTDDEDFIFEINENSTVALREILEDNIENQDYDELDQLLELYNLFEDGKISKEEYEIRKSVIYSDDVYCTNCGSKLDADALFCPECGEEVIDE